MRSPAMTIGAARHKMMRGFMEYQMEQVLTDVGADSDQKSKLKALVTTTIDEVSPNHEARQTMRDEIIKAYRSSHHRPDCY